LNSVGKQPVASDRLNRTAIGGDEYACASQAASELGQAGLSTSSAVTASQVLVDFIVADYRGCRAGAGPPYGPAEAPGDTGLGDTPLYGRRSS